MIDEQLQFQISQYLDGHLVEADRLALESRLKTDPEARRVLEEYRRINTLLDAALPMPEMDWDKLTHRISAAVGQGVPAELVAVEAQSQTWAWYWRPVALAAVVLIVAAISLVVLRRGNEDRPGRSVAVRLAPVVQIAVLTPDQPAGAGTVDIEISKAPGIASASGVYPPDLTIQQPSRVTIAGMPVEVDDSMANQW